VRRSRPASTCGHTSPTSGARSIVDTARYIVASCSTEDITEGRLRAGWAQASRGGRRRPRATCPADKARARPRCTARCPKERHGASPRRPSRRSPSSIKARLQERVAPQPRSALVADVAAQVSPAPARAAGTQVEAELMTPMMQRLMPACRAAALDMRACSISPRRCVVRNPALSATSQPQGAALAERGACVMHEAPAPLAVPAWATLLEAKFGASMGEDARATSRSAPRRCATTSRVAPTTPSWRTRWVTPSVCATTS
jgi:hypothetical protein